MDGRCAQEEPRRLTSGCRLSEDCWFRECFRCARAPRELTIDQALGLTILPLTSDLGNGPRDALVQAGRLEIIRDPVLRRRLAEWPRHFEELLDDEVFGRRIVMEEIFPYLASRASAELDHDRGERRELAGERQVDRGLAGAAAAARRRIPGAHRSATRSGSTRAVSIATPSRRPIPFWPTWTRSKAAEASWSIGRIRGNA